MGSNNKDMSKQEKTVFFHPGLGKVASTYLQYKVFPHFRNIHYIQRTQYKKAPRIISKRHEEKFLISREFDKHEYLERESQFISGHFPDAKPILLLRRHDSWIASQYRRYAKNGYPWRFSDFFDHIHDGGKWKKKELLFHDKIKILENHFSHKPLVLFYEDMKKDPLAFIDRLARYMNASYDPGRISLSRTHTSYSENQMKATLAIGKRINIQPHIRLKYKIPDKLRHLYVAFIRYTTLYVAALLPESVFGNDPLIPEDAMKEIREMYQDDWERCVTYARENNPV